jgi:hypothetical protein
MSAVTVVLIMAAAACCGACVYGITIAVRRSRGRRHQVHAG